MPPKFETKMMNTTPPMFHVAPGSLTYNITTCYRDPKSGDFVVIPDTDVIVQNANGTLTEHLTKEMHVFTGTASGSSATTMMDKHYWQFATDHDKWPYMFVLRSLFATARMTATEMDFDSGRQTGNSASQIILDDLGPQMDPFQRQKKTVKKNINHLTRDEMMATIITGELPPAAPLTKKQIKRMRKNNVCPDCKQKHMCWKSGPSEGASQNYKCANCHVMFNMTPMGTERIKCPA